MGTKPDMTPTVCGSGLSTNLSWLLAQASYALQQRMTAALEEVGISPRSHCLLSTAMSGEFTQIEIAQAIGLDKTTMVVTVDQLEAEGLVERRPSPKDRRARIVGVTKAGEKVVAKAQVIADRVHAEVLDELPVRQREGLLGALGTMVTQAPGAECTQPARKRAPKVTATT